MTVNYVGHIDGVDEADAVKKLSDKVMYMAFRLYDSPGTGASGEKRTALWGRQASVALDGGDFDVDLSDTLGSPLANAAHVSLADAIAAAVSRGVSDLWLGVTPENDSNPEIFPRQKITAVPSALLAQETIGVADGFSVTNGTLSVDGALVVDGAARFGGSASYGDVKFADAGALSFGGGVAVEGTLRAGAVAATTLEAGSVSAGEVSAASLSVTGLLASAGAPTWNGALNALSATAGVGVVRAAVFAASVEAETLVVSNFVNNSTDARFETSGNSGWNPIGEWFDGAGWRQGEERQAMYCHSASSRQKIGRTSVVGGSWQAPCDCLAYFNVHLYNMSATHGAYVQFYAVESADEPSFSTLTPIAVASLEDNSAGGTLDVPVPLLLRKGQLVRWLGYNNNQNESSGRSETTHSCVESIRYRAFNW